MDKKGISPVIATILLIALTVAAVGIVAAILSGMGTPTTAPSVSLTLKGHYYPRYTDDDRTCIQLNHSGGDTVAPGDVYVLFRAKYGGRDNSGCKDVKGKVDAMGTDGPVITWTSEWSGTTAFDDVLDNIRVPYNPDPLAPGTYWEIVFEQCQGDDIVFDILEFSIVHKASGNVIFQNLNIPAPTVLS